MPLTALRIAVLVAALVGLGPSRGQAQSSTFLNAIGYGFAGGAAGAGLSSANPGEYYSNVVAASLVGGVFGAGAAGVLSDFGNEPVFGLLSISGATLGVIHLPRNRTRLTTGIEVQPTAFLDGQRGVAARIRL